MYPLLFVALSVVTAAVIAGSTNYLAIRMLFQPRRPLFLLGRKVPFTPGLIPKRKDEIASSLGRVVSEYLVTSSGLSDLLKREPFVQSVTDKLKEAIRRLARREETLEQLCLQWWTEEQLDKLKRRLSALLDGWTERGVQWLWEERGLSKLKLEQLLELLPEWSDDKRREWSNIGVAYIVEAVRAELHAERGERLIRTLVAVTLERTGGFLGTLAGIFMDEDKLAVKVRDALSQALDSPQIRTGLQQFLEEQLRKSGQLRLEDVAARAFAGEQTKVAAAIAGMWSWSPQLDALLQTRMDEVLGGRLHIMEDRLPGVVKFSLGVLGNQMENIVQAIELDKLAESQIKGFPVERLEEIILNVSGREFRAITWVGAFLGGIIGLSQSLFLLWLGMA